MASIAIVSETTTAYGLDYIEDVLTGLGHTLTRFLDTGVTDSNLSAYALIINYAVGSVVSPATLAGFYNDYMSTDAIPILFLMDYDTLTDDNFVTSSNFVQNIIGVNALNYKNRYVGEVDEAGYGFVVPETQFLNHEVSMVPAAHENAMGQGFLQPGFQGTFGGESFVWGVVSGTGDVTTAQPAAGAVAGTPLIRLRSTYWGDHREIAGCLISAGDSRVGQGTGTFPENCAWLGVGGGTLNGSLGHLLASAVRWCLGEYDSLTTYNTTAKSSAFRYPSFVLDSINGTTYGDSSIDWTETTPANTSVTVQASLDGEAFTTVSNGDPIPGLSGGNPLADKRLTIRVELATSDGVSTPQFSDLSVTLISQQAALTDTPADYFQEGHLLWTSGNNEGQAMEVKAYDDASKTMKLFLKMREPITVGDTFTVLPGCDKKKATCIAKFNNILNFQGEPDIPGEDQTLKTADVK